MQRAIIHILFRAALAAFVVSAAFPAAAAIPRYSTNPQDFVQSKLQHFWVNGQPFRFVGYNIRGLTHYGASYFYGESASERETNLAYMQAVGAKVARVFVSYRFATPQQISDGLNAALAVAAQHDVRLIVAFTDVYYGPNFHPPGDYVYYNGDGILGPSFYSTGYLNNYLPLVQALVARFKDDPTVFAWQLGNELKCPWNPGDVLAFSHSMASYIRAIDQRHMLSFGTAGRVFSGLSVSQATQLYQDFDFLTIHVYNGDNSLDDSGLANQLRKPLLVSEAGFDCTEYSNRPASTDADIAKWIGRGARGYMNWGLMAADNGDGDDIFGIDPFNHAYDWNAYTTVFRNWATALAVTPMPAPDPPPTVSASHGTYGDRIRVTWTAAFAACEYAVFRSTSSTGAKTQVSAWQSGCAFDDSGISRGTIYYYWVKARNSGGESGYSAYCQGWASDAPQVSVSEVKRLCDGDYFVTGGIVSAVFRNEFFIQSGRCSGLRVSWGGLVQEGDPVSILGRVSTPAGERILSAVSVVQPL